MERRWRQLCEHPEVELVRCDLPEGVRAIYATDDQGHAAILVSRRLGQVDRLAAVLHELAHHQRGGGCHRPGTPPLLRVATEREERRVRGMVADAMVPPDLLQAWVERRAEDGMVVARDVMEEFDVPADVADLALRRLAAGF